MNVYWSAWRDGELCYTLAATEKGLCYIDIDHNYEELQAWHSKYAKESELIENPSYMSGYIEQFKQYWDKQRTVFDLPLDMRGTDFQKRVWQALVEIPFGKTVSYRDIAETIGNRKAVRAVGGAIGKNPVLIVVPCHRVIGSSGKLTGFSAGLDLKEKLLDHEQINY
ncbi:methylated-DNA--[protein]-cysteine S-methyltransferase [Paenibacillus septentrionalis]|uniref:Methylated-DNA--protein-cysteine methyltransferase n=1 Tax=Paenibacillus septentrionalis TaxID=429342 RepID=A0ABW1V1W5_9BACL